MRIAFQLHLVEPKGLLFGHYPDVNSVQLDRLIGLEKIINSIFPIGIGKEVIVKNLYPFSFGDLGLLDQLDECSLLCL